MFNGRLVEAIYSIKGLLIDPFGSHGISRFMKRHSAKSPEKGHRVSEKADEGKPRKETINKIVIGLFSREAIISRTPSNGFLQGASRCSGCYIRSYKSPGVDKARTVTYYIYRVLRTRGPYFRSFSSKNAPISLVFGSLRSFMPLGM